MKLSIAIVAGLLYVAFLRPASAQDVQVSRTNRSIDVTTTESVRADAEVAILTLGFVNYAATRDAAYEENALISNQVIQALLDGGLSKQAIHTEQFRLQSQTYNTPNGSTPQRQFYAEQTWTIRVRAADAQTIVDKAVSAGANSVGSVTWDVADPDALQQKADRAALAKAHVEAAELAGEFGGKVGELMYASNTPPNDRRAGYGFGSGTGGGAFSGPGTTPERPTIKLFPQPVERSATVHAVFALD
jgi:uncharacterized protein